MEAEPAEPSARRRQERQREEGSESGGEGDRARDAEGREEEYAMQKKRRIDVLLFLLFV
jgi:hypothetical protein